MFTVERLQTARGLREARLAVNVTQKDLAAALGMHPNTIARMERGELPIAHRTAVNCLALVTLHQKPPPAAGHATSYARTFRLTRGGS